MTSAAMHSIGDDNGRFLEERMESIRDYDLTTQTPGIITSRRTRGPARRSRLFADRDVQAQ